jgi:hypothetical protein
MKNGYCYDSRSLVQQLLLNTSDVLSTMLVQLNALQRTNCLPFGITTMTANLYN